MKEKKLALIYTILVGLVVFAIGVNLSVVGLSKRHDRMKSETQILAHTQEERLEHILLDKLIAVNALETLVINENGDIKDFQSMASRIFGEDKCIRCIQLAKDGLITPESMWPYEGNEAGVGNLLSPLSPRYEMAKYIKDNKLTIISIPKDNKLHQGGSGPILRRAIFLTDEYGKEEFWGFIVVIMDFPAILSEANFARLEQNYDYRLTGVDEAGQTLLLSGTNDIPEDAAYVDVSIRGTQWKTRDNHKRRMG